MTVALGVLAVVVGLVAWSVLRAVLRHSVAPGDYETELIRLCNGDRGKVDRLIAEELRRAPGTSRVGAAMKLVTRIRHERDPQRPSL